MFGLFSKKIKPKNAFEAMLIELYGNPPPPAQRANLDKAIEFAHKDLLAEIIDLEKVRQNAEELYRSEVPHSTEELALSVARNFFKEGRYTSSLAHAQLGARMTLLGWLTDKKEVNHFLARSFEDDLYELYK